MESPELMVDSWRQIKHLSGANELYQVTTFRGVKDTPDGQYRWFTVQILHDPTGYYVRLIRDDGHWTAGNPADDLYSAIDHVHWDELDKELTKK